MTADQIDSLFAAATQAHPEARYRLAEAEALVVAHLLTPQVGILTADADGGTGLVTAIRVRSRSRAHLVHTVTLDGSCDCEWQRKGHHRNCTHALAARAFMRIIESA